MENITGFVADAAKIKRLGIQAGLSAFQHWINEIAVWLEDTFPDVGYSAEWLSLDSGPCRDTRRIKGQQLHKSLEKAVNERISWLIKLEKISEPGNDDGIVGAGSAPIILGWQHLLNPVSLDEAESGLEHWEADVTRWLLERHVESEIIVEWHTLAENPFSKWPDDADDPLLWASFREVVRKRYRWLAELISRSITVERQYHNRYEADDDRPSKINFDGPGYELIALLKETLQQEGGRTRYRLFADDESIYEYAAFKFLVRGKEMSVKQLKKSVENKQYL